MSIANLLPAIVNRGIFKLFKSNLSEYLKHSSQGIPICDLHQKHVQNARLVSSRLELLKLMPKEAIVAELGVDKGAFSKEILETSKPRKLHLVDTWGSSRYNSSKMESVRVQFSDQLNEGKVEIHHGLSTEVVSQFKDGYFDWVYIDTDHTYETTKRELERYASKLKPGGVIAGHDYVVGNWYGMFKYGVVEAVNEFCVKNDWEIIYLSTELSIGASFAISSIESPS
ncbi:MAG: class I SAM-dependent methyltransferase [Cyclobacteriaceae bacterium]